MGLSLISYTGFVFDFNPLYIVVPPNVKQSISSEATPSANPPFTSSTHYASASPGAWTTGTPIIYNICLASSF